MLLLDMCQLVPHKRPSAKQVLARLAQLQAALPPVDLSEGSDIYRRLQAHEASSPAQVAAAAAAAGGAQHAAQQQRRRRTPGDESPSESDDSESPLDEEVAAAAEAEESLLAMHLRRALSADSASGFKVESNVVVALFSWFFSKRPSRLPRS